MQRTVRTSLSFSAFILIISVCLAGDDKNADGFTPVAPPQAVGRVLKMNLGQVEHWCEENDLASAAKASQASLLLATFLARHANGTSTPAADKLLKDCNAIRTAANAKDMAQTKAKLTAANACLAEMIGALPRENHSWNEFKPTGSNGAWMGLLDSAYADAKYANDSEDFEALTLTLAEEANIVAQLRKEPRWRQMAFDVRDAALVAAKQSRDLPKAKQSLHALYARCETCHDAYRR